MQDLGGSLKSVRSKPIQPEVLVAPPRTCKRRKKIEAISSNRRIPIPQKAGFDTTKQADPGVSKQPVVIATAMSVSGPLRLFTNANVVVHPHYESEQLRKRVSIFVGLRLEVEQLD